MSYNSKNSSQTWYQIVESCKDKKKSKPKINEIREVIVVNVWPLGLIYKVYIPSNIENIPRLVLQI